MFNQTSVRFYPELLSNSYKVFLKALHDMRCVTVSSVIPYGGNYPAYNYLQFPPSTQLMALVLVKLVEHVEFPRYSK